MQNDDITKRQGETYVLEQDFNTTGSHRPNVIVVDGKQRQQPYRGYPRYYNSYSIPTRRRRFMNYRGYVPIWFQELWEHVWDRIALIFFTVICSHIVFVEWPVLSKALFQP